VSQQPLRKKPVTGSVEHGSKTPPRTLTDGSFIVASLFWLAKGEGANVNEDRRKDVGWKALPKTLRH
jgi:hypothetical protein